MAIRWKDTGFGVQHGYLGGVRIFTLLGPELDATVTDGTFTLSSDLPGAAAGQLVAKRYESAEAAKRRAHQFVSAWLERHREELEAEPDPADGQTWWKPQGVIEAERAEILGALEKTQ